MREVPHVPQELLQVAGLTALRVVLQDQILRVSECRG